MLLSVFTYGQYTGITRNIIVMAAAVNSDHKKKSSHHVDRTPRDGSNGMNAQTQRHFRPC